MADSVYIPDAAQACRRLYGSSFEEMSAGASLNVAARLETMTGQLHAAHSAGDKGVAHQISNWHIRWIGSGSDPEHVERIMAADFSLDDARLTIAKEHGFADWPAVEASGDLGFNPKFEAAVDALLAGNAEALAFAVSQDAGLLSERSPCRHAASLLHYAASNGVETWRQVVPRNLPEIVEQLIVAGADVNATANVYGGLFTPLALAETSAHPKDAGIGEALVAVLKG